jgi:phage-related protein
METWHNSSCHLQASLFGSKSPGIFAGCVWSKALWKLSQTCYISIMKWDIKYHDEKLQADVLALPPGILARYFHCTDRMMEFGPDLGMPHTRAMSSGLFELRLKSREGIGRVFFCTVVNRKIVMLHQFVKKTDKTPPKELALARKRMKEWKDVDA